MLANMFINLLFCFRISNHDATSPLSHQSAYSIEQLLASLNVLASLVNTNPTATISSALVLQSLVSYQPHNLAIRVSIASSLVGVVQKWFGLLIGVLNHSMLVGDKNIYGMAYVVVCQLGQDVLR
jgi:hypothetical protein